MADDMRIETGAGEETSRKPVIQLRPDGPPGVGPETTFSSSARRKRG
jgi:hypothetical protein